MAGGVWREHPPLHLRRRRALVLLALGGLAYWWLMATTGEQVTVILAPVVAKDMPVYVNGLGTVQAYNTVTVHAQADGQLTEVAFKEGQDVHKGDVLARIDPRMYQAQYDQAVANKAQDEAALESARHELKQHNAKKPARQQTLLSTIRQFEAAVKSDQAAIDNAQTLLSYTVITSPINGRVGMRQVDAGNMVHTSDANGLVAITQMEPVSVVFSLPQQNTPEIGELLNLKKNASVKLKVEALEPDSHKLLDTGELELADNQAEPVTGAIRFKATFPNAKRLLWPGGVSNVRMLVAIRHNALVVPASSIINSAQNSYVFLLKPDQHKVTMRMVRITMIDDHDAVIEEGVQAGDRVVVEGMGTLREGSTVSAADAPRPKM